MKFPLRKHDKKKQIFHNYELKVLIAKKSKITFLKIKGKCYICFSFLFLDEANI